MCGIARKPICVTRRRKNISPGGLIWRAVAVIEDRWEYQDLHSSDRWVSFTGGLCVSFTDPRFAFTDLCAAFTNHSSTCVASPHLDGSVHLLFEAFISFFPSKASAHQEQNLFLSLLAKKVNLLLRQFSSHCCF